MNVIPFPAPANGRTLPESSPFMRLARSWEAESRRLRLDPERPCPQEIGKRRMAELNALLAGKLEA